MKNVRQPNEDLFENSRMSFGEHLEELRHVLFRCLIWLAIGCVFGFTFANQVVRILKKPLVDAIGEYRLTEAADKMVAEKGYLAPELAPWLEKDKLLPQQMRVDPAQLVAALQTVIPDFGANVKIEPYRFQAKNFKPNDISPLAQQMIDSGDAVTAEESSSAKTKARKIRAAKTAVIWDLLKPGEKDTIRNLATQASPTTEQVQSLADIFNRIAGEERLFDSPAFGVEVTQKETWVSSWMGETKVKPLASMKSMLEKKDDPSLARRLNRALINQTFGDHMPPLRMELVPIEMWESSVYEPQSLGVSETFMVWVKAGIITGLVFAFPFIFYHLWSFVAAGLYPHEQKYVHIFLPVSIGLFVSGVLLAFFFVFQPVLGFLFSFNRQMGISPDMRINYWLSFVMFMPLGFGLAFQLPLVMLFMNRIGLFQVRDYLSKWRIAILVIFILAMLLTPADPISMLLLAIPLTILYFLGIAMCHWMPKNQNPFGESETDYVT